MVKYIECLGQKEITEFIESSENYKETRDEISPDLKLYEKKAREVKCEKCKMLMKLFERTPMTNKDYWLMTELFVMLHGSDVCRGEGSD